MGVKSTIEKTAPILFAFSFAWMVCWFGGVHPSESWVGSVSLLVCFTLMSFDLHSRKTQISIDRTGFLLITLLLSWLLLANYESVVCYNSIKSVVGYSVFLLVLFLVKKHNPIRRNANLILRFALLCGFFISVYAVYQRLTSSKFVLGVLKPDVYSGRYGGVFINPNHLASFLICLHPIILAQIIKSNLKNYLRLLCFLIYLLMGGAIFLTMSRGGWVGLLFGSLIVVSVKFFSNYRLAMMGTVLCLIISGLVAFNISAKFKSRINSITVADSPDSGMFRIWLWKAAFQMWSDNKLTGVGPGQFQVRFPRYRPPTIPSNPEYVHNEYLEILVEYGGVGFVGMILIFYKIIITPLWFNLKSLIENKKLIESGMGCWLLGCIGGVLSLLVHAIFEFSFHVPAIAFLGALLIGINWNASEMRTNNEFAKVVVINNYISLISVLIITVIILRANLQYAREDLLLRKASTRGVLVLDRIEYLNRARKLQPSNPKTIYGIGEELRLLAETSPKFSERGFKDAMDYFKQSAKLDPNFPGNFMSMGLCFKKLGDIQAAIEELKKANIVGTNDVKILNCLTHLLIENGDLAGARFFNRQSLNINWWNNIEGVYFKNQLVFND